MIDKICRVLSMTSAIFDSLWSILDIRRADLVQIRLEIAILRRKLIMFRQIQEQLGNTYLSLVLKKALFFCFIRAFDLH